MLTTDRLTLRPLDAADAPWIAREIARPEVHRWLTSPPHPYRRVDAEAFLARFAGVPGFRTVCLGAEPLGVISIEEADHLDPDRPALPELGYWLAAHAWGRGYMTEAARAMLDWHAVTTGGPVYSGVIRGNAASARVLDKLGFQPLETVTRRSEFHDGPVTIERVVRIR